MIFRPISRRALARGSRFKKYLGAKRIRCRNEINVPGDGKETLHLAPLALILAIREAAFGYALAAQIPTRFESIRVIRIIRGQDMPLVTSSPRLTSNRGYPLGALCLGNKRPSTKDKEQIRKQLRKTHFVRRGV